MSTNINRVTLGAESLFVDQIAEHRKKWEVEILRGSMPESLNYLHGSHILKLNRLAEWFRGRLYGKNGERVR